MFSCNQKANGGTEKASEYHEIDVDHQHDRSILSGLAGLLDSAMIPNNEGSVKKRRSKGFLRQLKYVLLL